MLINLGKNLYRKGYPLETFFLVKKQGRKHFCYEYTIYMERIDTFTFNKKASFLEFIEKMKEQGYHVGEWPN